jgi:CBS domain-containing membrane protein
MPTEKAPEVPMADASIDACAPVDISDDDIYEAMKDISGYLDITPADFKEVYLKAYRHAVTRLTRSVKARDVMTRDVASVGPDTPLEDVAQMMADRKVSGVPVVDRAGKVVGVISEKDFLVHLGTGEPRTFMEVVAECLKGSGCLAAPLRSYGAADFMNSPAVTVTEETPVMEIAQTFLQHKINRVPVVDHDGRLMGIVSRADVVRSSLL